MEQQQRTRRFGAAVIAFAICLRLLEAGVPGRIASWLAQANIDSILSYVETGRDVRFSASNGGFSPFFRESPPPWSPQGQDETITPPAFTPEDGELVSLYNTSGKDPDIPALLQQQLNWDLRGEEPAVLILHTHTTESYTKTTESYRETSSYRTLEEDYNMLSVGQEVARILEENGIRTIQDRTFHDYPSYNGSYVHARNNLSRILKEHPSILLVLDLHRDASSGSGSQMRPLTQVEGEPTAQMMLVMGTNYDTWQQNLALAAKLQVILEKQAPGIMRPVNLRGQRFNQDLSQGALLVEMGAAGNTHPEAMAAARQLALAIVTLAEGTA